MKHSTTKIDEGLKENQIQNYFQLWLIELCFDQYFWKWSQECLNLEMVEIDYLLVANITIVNLSLISYFINCLKFSWFRLFQYYFKLNLICPMNY